MVLMQRVSAYTYIHTYRKPSSVWQGTKEKFLRKSPHISLHYAGISLRSELHKYHCTQGTFGAYKYAIKSTDSKTEFITTEFTNFKYKQ